MQFRANHLLRSLCLASCVLSATQPSTGQDAALIEHSVAPRWKEVQTVSGKSDWLGYDDKATSRSVLRIANANPQPPAIPNPPANSGPSQLPNRESFPSDKTKSESANGRNNSTEKDEKDRDQADNDDKEAANKESANKRSANALTPLQNRELSIPVRVVDLSVADLGTGSLPESAADKQPKLAFMGRGAVDKCVHWHPSEICHFPLRFEEPMLERHGHVRFGCWQSFASGAKFFATIPLLPYLHTLRPTFEPVYALGSYRPGSDAPLLRETLPYDQRAAVTEALSLAGFFWAMPL